MLTTSDTVAAPGTSTCAHTSGYDPSPPSGSGAGSRSLGQSPLVQRQWPTLQGDVVTTALLTMPTVDELNPDGQSSLEPYIKQRAALVPGIVEEDQEVSNRQQVWINIPDVGELTRVLV